MASLQLDSHGYRLQFSVPGRPRRRVRLTTLGEDAAERAKHHVEVALRSHRRRQPIPVTTLDWLFQSAPPRLLTELSDLGVVDDRRLLGDATRSWILSARLELSTKRVEQSERMAEHLLAHFGDMELELISSAALHTWRDTLAVAFEPNTVSSYVADAKQFFRWAVGQRLLLESPAASLPTKYTRSARLCEVPPGPVLALCQAAPAELALALRLARWGGLRAAEILRVRVADIDCTAHAIAVRDTKRAKSGHGSRRVPLFPELEPVRVAALERDSDRLLAGRPGLLLPELGSLTTSAMDQRAKRLCAELDIATWPRLWQNMRATRESELMDRHSLKDVCSWIGNSPKVAMDHYAMVRQVEFDRAIGKAA